MKPSLDKLSREEVQIIAKHSNWNQQKVEENYKTHIYPNKEQWVKFIQYFLLAIGIGFLTAGVVFFFAYNWDNLHKFTKLGLVQGTIIALGATAILAPISKNFRLILLTSLAILIGVLFAVYGLSFELANRNGAKLALVPVKGYRGACRKVGRTKGGCSSK